MTPARTHVHSILGFDPGSALPNSGYGDLYLRRLGLGGLFVFRDHHTWEHSNRRASCRRDAWDAAVLLADAEDAWRRGGDGNVELRAAAALVMAGGDAWWSTPPGGGSSAWPVIDTAAWDYVEDVMGVPAAFTDSVAFLGRLGLEGVSHWSDGRRYTLCHQGRGVEVRVREPFRYQWDALVVLAAQLHPDPPAELVALSTSLLALGRVEVLGEPRG